MDTDISHVRRRIMIVIGTLAIGGGAEKVAATIGSELTGRGHEVHLLTFYEAEQKYPFSGIYATFGEPIIYNRFKKIWRLPQRIYKIWRYAKSHDITMAISFLEEANFYTLLVKLLVNWRLPVIVSVRNNIEQRGFVFRWLSRLLYPFAKKVVSVTRAVEEVLKSKYGLRNTTTIYNPLDTDLIERRRQEPLPREYEWLVNSRPLCITIGRLTHQKGQWHLVRSFASVCRVIPKANLIVIGDGEYKSKLKQLIVDCGLDNNVHLLGKHENVYQYLAVADLFVFSSLWEGMPNTMLEALAVGLPIVSADCVSGPREIIAPTVGVLAPLSYPYEAATGTLTAPLTKEAIWASPDLVPLTGEEKQLAEVIIRRLQKINTIENNEPEAPYQLDSRFVLDSIINEWEREINL